MANKKNTTIASLVAAYNDAAKTLGKKPVKSFKDTATAQSRTKAILKELAKAGKGTKAAAKGKAAGGRKRSDNPIDFVNVDVRLPREGSLPGVLLARVTKDGGATMAQLEAVVTKHDEANELEPANQYGRVVRTLRHLYHYNKLGLKWDGSRVHGTMPK